MPIRRFRTLEESAAVVWRRPDDPDLPREIAEVWRLGDWLAPCSFPPGVHRFRSIEALNSQREKWERTLVKPRFRREMDLPPFNPADS